MTEPKRYVGTKAVLATPMTRVSYNAYRGWPLPANENPDDAGYLVEYLDGGKPNHPRHPGYISWSPAAQFEAAYRERPDVPGLDWRQRVADELADLKEKTEALGRFLGDAEAIRYISTQALELLDDQHTVMARYQSILRQRLGIDGSTAQEVRAIGSPASPAIAASAAAVYGKSEKTQRIQPARDEVEAEILAKGLTAPRVTPDDVEANIVDVRFFTAGQAAASVEPNNEPIPLPLQLLTICVLTLRNGFTVLGTSACASPENFDQALGEKIARNDAVGKVWPLMGYALRERLQAEAVEAQAKADAEPKGRERFVLTFEETAANKVAYTYHPAGWVAISAATSYRPDRMEHCRGVVFDVPAGAVPPEEFLTRFGGFTPVVSDRRPVK